MTDQERITALEVRVAQLEARVAQLEARPSTYPNVTWVGKPHTGDSPYAGNWGS